MYSKNMESLSSKKVAGLVKYVAKCAIEFAKQIESLQYRNKTVMNKNDVELTDVSIVKQNLNITCESATDTSGIIFSELLRLKNRIVKLVTGCIEQNIYVNYDSAENHNLLYNNLDNNARTLIVDYLSVQMMDFVEYIYYATDLFKGAKPDQTCSDIKKKLSTIYKTLKTLSTLPEVTKTEERFEKTFDNSQFCNALLEDNMRTLNKFMGKFNRAYLKGVLKNESASADEKISMVSVVDKVKDTSVEIGETSFKVHDFIENGDQKSINNVTGEVVDAVTNLIHNLESKKRKLDSDKEERKKRKKNNESFKLPDFFEKNNQSNIDINKSEKKKIEKTNDVSVVQIDDTRKNNRKQSNSELSDSAESSKKIIIDKQTNKTRTTKDKFKSNEFINTLIESDDEIPTKITSKKATLNQNNSNLDAVNSDEKPPKKNKNVEKERDYDPQNSDNYKKDGDKPASEEIFISKSNLDSDNSEEKHRKKDKRRKKDSQSSDESKKINDKPAKISRRRASERIVNKSINNLDSTNAVKNNAKEDSEVKKNDVKPAKIKRRRATEAPKSNINLDSDHILEGSRKIKEIIETTKQRKAGTKNDKNKIDDSDSDSGPDKSDDSDSDHSDEQSHKIKELIETINQKKARTKKDTNKTKDYSDISCEPNKSDADDPKKEKDTKRKGDSKTKTWREKKIVGELLKETKTEIYKNPNGETIDSLEILSAIEAGDLQVDFEENEFDDLINTIKINDLSENERFLYIQDFVNDKRETIVLSEHLIEKLSELNINVDWDIPQGHTICSRLSTIPTVEEREELSKLGIVYGTKFTAAETEILKENWEAFSKKYEFADPNPFLTLVHPGHKTYLKFNERKKFIQFLGQNLPHKALYSIYKRFKTVYTRESVKQGRFSPEEDLLILSYMKKLKRKDAGMKFSKLAPAMNRDRTQIERRYKVLKELSKRKVWTKDKQEILVQHLLDGIKSENINDLRDISYDHPVFVYAGTQMDTNIKSLKTHFFYQLSTRLFSQIRLFTSKMKVQIIERLIEKKERDWKEVDWSALAIEFKGVTPHFLWYLLRCTLHFVPKKHHKNLKFCLRFLREYYLPNLKKSSQYATKHVKRLKWVHGKLEEYF